MTNISEKGRVHSGLKVERWTDLRCLSYRTVGLNTRLPRPWALVGHMPVLSPILTGERTPMRAKKRAGAVPRGTLTEELIPNTRTPVEPGTCPGEHGFVARQIRNSRTRVACSSRWLPRHKYMGYATKLRNFISHPTRSHLQYSKGVQMCRPSCATIFSVARLETMHDCASLVVVRSETWMAATPETELRRSSAALLTNAPASRPRAHRPAESPQEAEHGFVDRGANTGCLTKPCGAVTPTPGHQGHPQTPPAKGPGSCGTSHLGAGAVIGCRAGGG